jgi:transcriptional regulator with XRE-family HTH domain
MNIQLIEDKITGKGLNKATIAKEMGMSKQSFNAFLKSDNPTLQKLRALSNVLGVTITSLIDEDSEEDIKKRSQEIVAFIRYKGIHYTADSLDEFFKQVEEIKTIAR